MKKPDQDQQISLLKTKKGKKTNRRQPRAESNQKENIYYILMPNQISKEEEDKKPKLKQHQPNRQSSLKSAKEP